MSRIRVAAVVLVIMAPLTPLVVWAFSDTWRYPALLPQRASVRGWRLLLDPSSDVQRALLTSLTISVLVTLLALVVGVPAGRALGLYDFRGRRVIRYLLLAPAIVPAIAVLLGTQVLFLRLGLADTVVGVALVQLVPTVPYVVSVMTSAFSRFDVRLEQQSRVLGAGPIATLVRVTLPALSAPLVISAYFAFLISWGDCVLTLLIGGGTVSTLPLLLYAYLTSSDLTQAAAVALLLALPPGLLLIVLHRRLGDGPVAPIGLVKL